MTVRILSCLSVWQVEISLADSEYGLWATFPGTPGEASGQKTSYTFLDPRVRLVQYVSK